MGQCWHKSIWAVWASRSRRKKACKTAAVSVGESPKGQQCTQSSLIPYHLPLSCFWITPRGPFLLAVLRNVSCTFQLVENFSVQLHVWRRLAVSLAEVLFCVWALALCRDFHSQLWDRYGLLTSFPYGLYKLAELQGKLIICICLQSQVQSSYTQLNFTAIDKPGRFISLVFHSLSIFTTSD